MKKLSFVGEKIARDGGLCWALSLMVSPSWLDVSEMGVNGTLFGDAGVLPMLDLRLGGALSETALRVDVEACRENEALSDVLGRSSMLDARHMVAKLG